VGRAGDFGIAPKISESLLKLIEHRRGQAEMRGETATYTVTVSMLEIYNECLIDLLQPKNKDVVVRVLRDNVSVEGLTTVPLTSVERVVETVQTGFLARHQASTCGNSESSRGHAVLIFEVRGHRGVQGAEVASEARIFLVDLAGCENLSKAQLSEEAIKKLNKKPNPQRAIEEAQAVLQAEMKRINVSLSTLRKVIEEAAAKKGTPIAAICRESKLTLVLRECFGGRNLAVLLCCCSPLEKHSAPTLNTLEFGDVFRRIENRPEAAESTTPDWHLVAQGLRRALCRVDGLMRACWGGIGGALGPGSDAAAIVSQALIQSDAAFGYPAIRGDELAEAARQTLAQALGVAADRIVSTFGSVCGRDSGHPGRLSVHVTTQFAKTLVPMRVGLGQLEALLAPSCSKVLSGACGSGLDLLQVQITDREVSDRDVSEGDERGTGGLAATPLPEGVDCKMLISAHFVK